jgi:RND family efflux transporter MFP subunit
LAQVSQKEAAQKAAEVRLSYTQIRVDWLDGDDPRVVGQKFVDEGAMLKPNDPISSVLDIRSLVGDIHVTERDYPKLQVGQEAAVTTDAYPGQTFTGKAVRIAPALKEASREALVELAIPNPDGALKPGMFVRAKMEFAKHDGVTRVPVTALVRRNGQQGVFLADAESQKAKFVAVTLGIVDERAAEVTEPPLAGNVVTLGQHLLEDGAAIVLPGSKPGPPAAKMPPAAGKPPAGGER